MSSLVLPSVPVPPSRRHRAAVGLLLLLAVALPFGELGILALLGVGLLGWAAMRPVSYRFEADGARPVPWGRSIEPEPLVLEGTVGDTVVLRTVSGKVLSTVRPGRVEELAGLARRVAETWSMELDDRLEWALWERYLDDPVFRATVDLARDVERNRSRHPRWHGMEAAPPDDARWSLGGLAFRLGGSLNRHPIELDGQVLTVRGRRIPLEQIDAIGGLFVSRSIGQGVHPYQAQLHIVRGGRREKLVDVVAHAENIRALHLLVREVERARRQLVERGTEADVPEALRRTRSLTTPS